MLDRIVRDPETEKVTGLSPTTIWRLEKAGKFPKKRKISANAVGRLESEIAEWQQIGPEGWVEKHGGKDAAEAEEARKQLQAQAEEAEQDKTPEPQDEEEDAEDIAE